MWVCRNCNEVNTSDDLSFCRICDADRNAPVEVKRPESGWACASCGKRNPIKLRYCPVCNTPRYSGEIDRAVLDARPPEGRCEALLRRAATRIEAIGLPKIVGGFLAACLLLFAAYWFATRGPSDDTVRRWFEATELTRLNSEFTARKLEGPDGGQAEALRGLDTVSAMLRRLAVDCGSRMPSAFFMDQAHGDVNPELFRKELIKVGRAVERYVGSRIGPIGAGYALREIRVVRMQGDRSGGFRRCTVDYEATLAAVEDVLSYRPPYLAGQEHLPLVVDGDIDWGNFDRFYAAWLDRKSERSLAAAAEFDRTRGSRTCPRSSTRTVKGSAAFVKAGDGWTAIAGPTP